MTGPPACNVVGGSVDTCQAVTSPLATATLGIYAPGNLQFEGNRAAYVLISHGRRSGGGICLDEGRYAYLAADVELSTQAL